MACYHPLKGFQIGITDNGKPKYKIVPFVTDHVERINGNWIPVTVTNISRLADRSQSEFVVIPCGQCLGCRLDYSREWANRLMLEKEYYEEDQCYFVTLTYSDNMLPRCGTCQDKKYCKNNAGSSLTPTVCKRDFQLFMKKLRKDYANISQDKIRFFAAFEYGEKTARPHVHAILYGVRLSDLAIYRIGKTGYPLFNSEFLSRCWSRLDRNTGESHSLGYVVIAPVTWECCAYTARYILKKQRGENVSIYDELGIMPESTLMSRRPGIARQWYEDHPNLDAIEYINLSTPNGGRKFRPPKYYAKLFEVDDPPAAEAYKEVRKAMAENAMKLKMARSQKSYLEVLADEEYTLKEKAKKLIREEV